MHTEMIEYREGSTMLGGYLAYDTALKDKRPAVIVCHAWAGQDDFVRAKAEALAALGYAGFALDMYGQGVCGRDNDENARLMKPFVEDRALLAQRVNAAAAEVRRHIIVNANAIGAIGFCFGGMCALDLARSGAEGVKGVVAFHGLLGAPSPQQRPAKKITAKVLALHGWDDPYAPPDAVLAFAKEMTAAQADWQLHAFGNQVHAFTNPGANDRASGLQYDKASDERSWRLMKDFFEEVFG